MSPEDKSAGAFIVGVIFGVLMSAAIVVLDAMRWQWITGHWGREKLRDENGRTVMRANSVGTFDVASEEEAELIRMAPEAIHQQRVREFHAKFGQPIGERPQFSRPELRASLNLEEAIESAVGLVGTVRALELLFELARKHHAERKQPDMVETADGLCDMIYVALGCAVEMGIDLAPLFEEVHATNMAKVNGPVRGDGKILKPEGWQPPQIAKLLREQGWNG